MVTAAPRHPWHGPRQLPLEQLYHVACTPITSKPPSRQATSPPSPIQPAQPLAGHVLVDTGREKRRALAEAAGDDGRRTAATQGSRGKSHGGCSGVCALKKRGGLACTIAKPKRSQLYCRGCDKYFHLECFFKEHYCRLLNA